MKVTIEYTDPFEASRALASERVAEFIEEFENFLMDKERSKAPPETIDKWRHLKGLYQI